MKSINTASAALRVAERELTAGVNRLTHYPQVCTGEMYGTLSRSIKNIAKTNELNLEPDEPCYQCEHEIKTPYMFSRVFCSQKHLEEYENDISDNECAMQTITLGDSDAIRANLLYTIALHKLQGMTLSHEASAVVSDVLIQLAKDYGEA